MKTAVGGLVTLAVAGAAIAANVHLKALPTFVDMGEGIVEACVSLAGLGNQDIVITVTLDGEATVVYNNPGGNEPPGQNKIPVQTVGSETVPSEQIQNGNVSVCLETSKIEAPPAPNENWTTEISEVVYSRATITVVQKGKVVLEEVIEFDE